MRLLADENIPLASIRRLREAGHEVISASEVSVGSPDSDLLKRAAEEKALLFTFDRDFGALVFHHGEPLPKGVILLRFVPTQPSEAAEALLSLFDRSDLQLFGHFTVVEAERVRQRQLPQK